MIEPELPEHARLVEPSQGPNPARHLFEGIVAAGKITLLEAHARETIDRGRGSFYADAGDLMEALEAHGLKIPARLGQPLLRLFEEEVLVKIELDRLQSITGNRLQSQEATIKALVETYTGPELDRVPYWYPSTVRWLVQWAVDRHHDDFDGIEPEPARFTAYSGYQILAQEFQRVRRMINQEHVATDSRAKKDFEGGLDLENHGVGLLRDAGFVVLELGPVDAFKVERLVEGIESRIALQFHWMTPAGLEMVQAFKAAMEYYGAESGLMITPPGHSKAAGRFAASAGITFWGVEDLERFADEKVI